MRGRKPNFFIVGAPKCGTTALYHALLEHPEIYLPRSETTRTYWIQKEPMFFCDDLGIEDWIRVSQWEDYLALFAQAGGAPRVGEVSALYLLSESAPRRILDCCDDDVRIIILLRPPVDWMRSWHHDCLRYAHESIADFRQALDAEPQRRLGQKLPRHGGFKGCLNYRQAARFSESVERYFRLFGPDRVKVILMEDLHRHPQRVLEEITGFLGVSPMPPSGIERQNDSTALSRTHLLEFRLQRKWQSLPLADHWVGEWIKSPGRWYRRAMLKLFPPLSNKAIDPELRRQLVEEFRPEVERLSRLIGRDLSHWNEVTPERTGAPGGSAEIHHLPTATSPAATAVESANGVN